MDMITPQAPSMLTIFTSTYNRAFCLDQCYESLKRQTSKNFKWLIVDDGSTDNTQALVASWQQEANAFSIEYIYKENGGMYTGYNTAIAYMDTKLCVCVDSDDFLTDDAVEKILNFWQQYGSDQYAGIVGLDCYPDGKVVGDPLPDQKSINLIDLNIGRYKINNGDRKNVVRTELYKAVAPMAEFPGEKDFNPHYMHLEISRKYDFLVLNEKLCVVNYLPGGMHSTVFKQYLRSPQSFRETRLQALSFQQAPFKYVARNTIHYISSCIFSHKPCLSASPRKFYTIALYPLGILWTLFLWYYNRTHR